MKRAHTTDKNAYRNLEETQPMKNPIAFAIVSLTGFALSPAHAQSSVTLYGIVDTGFARIDDAQGNGSTQLRSGNAYTSRLGFRGAEDLGGGLKALYQLEAGILADTGNTSIPFFNRQSWVGLSSSQWGQLTLGRQLPTISDVFVASAHASYFGSAAAALEGAAMAPGSSAARFNNMIGGVRVDNAIKYQSASMSGFRVHAMAVLGEVAGSSSAGRMLSTGLSYNTSTIEAGLVYHESQCAEAGGCLAGKAKDKIYGLGGAYKADGARYAVTYTKQENAKNVRGNDADVITLLARVPIGQWVVQGGYQFLNDKTVVNQDVRQLNLGVNYLLSKRTSLYTIYTHQTVKNGGKAGMFSVLSSKDKQNQISAGITHTF